MAGSMRLRKAVCALSPRPTGPSGASASLATNSPGALSPEIPVFLAQGADDVIVHPDVTKAYAAKLCKGGSKVRMLSMPNIGHGRAAQASTQAMLEWVGDRFAGAAVPDDCEQ